MVSFRHSENPLLTALVVMPEDTDATDCVHRVMYC